VWTSGKKRPLSVEQLRKAEKFIRALDSLPKKPTKKQMRKAEKALDRMIDDYTNKT
jgi:hypothetical protein